MRVINFNAGPAALPEEALERAQRELLDLDGTGMSVIEHSHRGKTYDAVHRHALDLARELLAVPDTHDVLLLQGGASLQFAMLPLNFLHAGRTADYVITGAWSKKALAEAELVGEARIAATTEKDGKFVRVPAQSELDLSPDSAYVHVTSNNTIFGTQFEEFPETGTVPLAADMSSDILSRPLDVSRFGLIYAGAQKNLGPSGLALVVLRKEWMGSARSDVPKILRYETASKTASLYNTPPTFSVYLLRNVLECVKRAGGVAAMEKHNREKAAVLYEAIDADPDFYRSPVEKGSRSLMNVVFNLPTEDLEKRFVAEAAAADMVGLKGHRSVGGVRASIYNAAKKEWVETLVDFMQRFRKNA